MKGSNIPIIKNKRHPRPLSNINGKTKQFKNNQVCRATLCKTDQTRIARLFCRLSCKERREDALALRADERRDKLAISFGEEQISIDPQISEWGNPAEQTSVTVY